ncbi:MAG TPA: DUF1015 domain-containing protein [Dehalococcoidia bacterium]|nr:DUF1015 domain-containing protein [Dehalococcoidia bacterium]
MADIRPFRGVRYDQSVIGNPASVICSPYDIITPPMRHELYQVSEYNFVRLEDGWGSPEDTVADSKYTRSAATLEQWLAQGVLKADEVPAIYLHDHYFMYQGLEYRRRGIIARIRLEEPGEMVVRRHEGTLAEPKDDRLSLLWALQANTSPILALFEDRQQQVTSLLAAQEKVEPEISGITAGGERHQVRAITEAVVIDRLNHSLANRALYIADGHHRYESALIYRQQREACSPSVSGDEMFNFVMMTLVDFTDPGLIVLPPHRLIRGVSRTRLSGLMAGLEAFFSVEALPLATTGVWQQVDRFLGMGTDEVKLVMFGQDSQHLYLLKLSDPAAASRMMPYFHSELYKRLAVSVVDHVVLEELLGLGGAADEAVGYCYDKADAVQRVLDREYQLAFMISPIPATVVKAIADAGDRMPRKSTYFYPKAPAGLVFNRLV